MPLRDWPASERPRERLLTYGPEALSDVELLAIVLRTGAAGESAVAVARRLVAGFGGLRALFGACRPTLCAARGIGPAQFAVLQAVAELGRRYHGARLSRGEVIDGPPAMRSMLYARMRDYPSEVFACVFLDNRHRVICFDPVFQGTVDGASVYPREVVRRAIAHNAAAVVAAHNHPSGVAEPSAADRAITRRLRDALALIDVRLLDHLVYHLCSSARCKLR